MRKSRKRLPYARRSTQLPITHSVRKLKKIVKEETITISKTHGNDRPITRADCKDGCRPCPWVSCKFHLYLEVTNKGSIKIIRPDIPVEDMEDSCLLDVIDEYQRVPETKVMSIMNYSHARVFQVYDEARKSCESYFRDNPKLKVIL